MLNERGKPNECKHNNNNSRRGCCAVNWVVYKIRELLFYEGGAHWQVQQQKQVLNNELQLKLKNNDNNNKN